MRQALIAAAILALVVFVVGVWIARDLTSGISRSNIGADVPAAQDFDDRMHRDLIAYFQRDNAGLIDVDFELLRRGPTQTEVSFPKYYAWVRVREAGDTILQGAVRMAAIDRSRFEVSEFVSSADIRANPAGLEQTFPRALNDEIVRRARAVAR